jgi:hypothetical protein
VKIRAASDVARSAADGVDRASRRGPLSRRGRQRGRGMGRCLVRATATEDGDMGAGGVRVGMSKRYCRLSVQSSL